MSQRKLRRASESVPSRSASFRFENAWSKKWRLSALGTFPNKLKRNAPYKDRSHPPI